MEEDPLKSELRRCVREERLGEGACCALCGHQDSATLVRVKRTLLEKHHVVGKAHDRNLCINLCATCHKKVTANALDAGAEMKPQPTFLHRLVMMLRALGSFLEMVGQTIWRWAADLLRLVEGLDKECPTWRNAPEAK